MSSIRELRNVTPETGSTQQSNSSGRLNPSVPANNASNPGNTGTVFSIRQLRGRTVPTPKLAPLTQPERIRPQAVVNPISEREMERRQARQRQNEVEQAASAVTAVGAALGVPAQEQAKFVQQGVGFLKSAEKAPKTEEAETKPRGLTLDQYKHEINEAIAMGDWTEADALARSLSVEPFSDENDYTKAAAYYDDVFNRENLSNNGGSKNEAITTARYIIDLADRSQWEELYLYMQSPDSATAKKAIKDAFGIDADSEKSREGNYYGLAEQLQEAINTYGYDRLSDGASEYKTMLANNVFYRRAESTLQRAGENEASSAQMDSYVRAQTAYYILDVLSGKLGVEDNGIPTKEVLQNSTTKYLLDYLKDFCKVDLHGINEENYRKMIRDAMAETSQKAKTMGGVLQKSGYDIEAVREYSKLVVQQGFEQERYAALEKWTRGMSDRTEATSAYFKNAYNESMGKAKALQKAGQDVAAAREYAKAKAYGKMVNLAGLPEVAEYTAANVMTIPYRAYSDPITSLASVTSLAGKGSDTNDPNSYTPKLGSVSGTDLIRSATSEALEKNTDWNIFGRNVASFLYNTGMSAVDSAVSALSFGNMSIFAMGTTAAGSEANNILSRGGSREQAFFGGIAAGVIEAVTEYVSVDKLLKNMGTVSSAKDWLKSVGQQMFTEGTEEMSSEVLNIIVDAVNMGNLSENSQAVKDYMENGFSYDEARTKVLYDNVGDVIESGLSGAISGGLTAGVTSAPGAIVGQRQQNAAKRIEAAAREIQQSASQQLQQTEQRAELVQENNPEAEVVKSHGTQLYLDAGTDLATAQSAGAVLDGILSGEITSENMSGKQADKLLLYKPYAAQLVSDALGVEIQKTETKSQARAAAKAAVLAYEQRIKAVATQENNAPSSVPQSVNTSSVRNDIASQTQKTASAAVPDVQEQTSAPRPAAETADQEALQMQSEQDSTRGDFYAQLPTEEGASTAPAGAMSYEDFKYRMRTDKEFRNRYTDEGAKGLSQEARNLRAYDLYQDRMGQMQSAAGTLSRTRFAEAYREINATKKNPAQDTEVDLAYQDYLEMQQDRTVTEAEQDTVPEDYIGLVENEISEAVPQEVREAVDALAKQFGLQISYEDIGSDNGYYIPGTNRVVLDINPVRSAVDDAGRSAYLFTVAHEVGHYARENMSEEAWESFEAHAVAAMGGETAVNAKMQEEDDDGNSIYNTEDLAREDVACDFLGKILSDKDALKQFCDAIRDRTVSQPAARGILGAIRKVLAKLAGNKAAKRSEASVQQSVAEGLELFAEDIEAGRKAASEIADALAELAKQPRPLMNSKQAEEILAEAKNKNAAAVHYSLKDAKKIGFDRLIKQFFDKTLSRANPIFISNAPTNAEAMFGTKAPFIISSSDMSKSTRENNGSSRSAHALSRNFIEHLPENIEKSVIGYLENRNGVNSFTFVCLDEETNSLVAVGGAINATYEGQTVNRVLSIFHISAPEFFLTKSGKDLVTTDIEKAKNILEKARIQSPALQNILDSGRIITQTNSVSQERTQKNAIDAAVRTPRLPTRQEAEAILAEAKKSNKEAVRKTSGTQSNIDNAADLTYNKNENGGDQNVSNRMDQGLAEGVPVRRIYDNRDAQARGNGRGHQGILRRNLSKSLSRAFNESGVVAAELYSFDGDRAAFSSALDAAREADAKNGWCVTPQSAEELSGKLTFMDDGSTIGFVLTDSGDIEGVFKNPEKNKTRRAMSGVMPQAIAAGGTKLDCYGTRLVRLYENYGFIPVARVAFNEEYANPGWDASKGKPDIFFMMHNGDSAETVVSKIGTYPHMSEEQLNNLPRYGKDGYDEAMAYRDGLLAERNNASGTPDADIRRSRKDSTQVSEEYKKPITAQDVQDLRGIGRKSINEFTADDLKKAQKWAYKFYQELGVKSPFFRAWFGDWRANDTKTKVKFIPVNSELLERSDVPRGDYYNKDTEWNIRSNADGIDETANKSGKWSDSYHALSDIDKMIENAVLLDTVVVNSPSNRLGENAAFMHHLYCPVFVNEKAGLAKIYVAETFVSEHKFYLLKIEKASSDMGFNYVSEVSTPDSKAASEDAVISVADIFTFVKNHDSDYEKNSAYPVRFSPRKANPLFMNEDGTPKVFYHGAKKNGGFTVFSDWQYFTEQKRYAERYAERGNQKSLYEVYLTADKVFDTRDEDAAQILDSIRQEYGLGELQDTGLPDWTDGYDITEYLSEHPELGYDAVLLDEGGDLVNGEPVSRGLSIVIKDSGQVKSAKDNIGTFDRNNPDIRRSRKDRQNETARVPKLPTRQEAEAILRRSMEEQKAREIAEEARRESSRRAFVENAPARRKSAKNTQLDDLVAKHGAIQPGENPVRDVAVPNRTAADTKVRRTVRTALEAEVTTDSLVPVIEDSIVAGNFDYKPKKNQRTVEEAHKWLETHKSAKAAYKAWLSDKSRHLNAGMIARGFVLYNTFATAANQTENATERRELQETAIDILHDISVMGTIAGQTAQAIRLLKQQTPDAQYYALERAVARLQSDINERFGEKKSGAPQIVIDKDLAGKWIQALRQGKTEQANDLETLLYQSIAAQVPKTVYDRINAWRYLAMLGNPKTLIRNASGNLAFTPMAVFKDQIGAALERIFLPKEQRTKYAGVRSFTKEGRELLKYADMDIESSEVQQMLSTRKYDDTNVNDRLGRAIAEKKSTFTLPGLKHWQAATRYAMEKMPFAGDDFYKGLHYKRSFASAAMARGYTAEDFRSGRISENERWEIRAYAAKQAMKATFNDANMVSNLVRRWRFKNKAANMLVEGVVPFKGTPANVLVRSVEYGPIGLLKALTADVYSVKTGRITGQEYIDRISSGLTGTALAGLGYLLAALGVIRVNADDDDEREGKQTYSLEMFGKSITLDWLSPSAIPLFMGAEINELMNGEGYESFADALIDTSSDFFAPILEMSMLSGAKDLLDNFVYAYSDGADAGTVIASLFVQPFFSYLGQFLPTIMSQTANALEPNRTTTYVGDISGKWARSFVRNVAKLTEKIPFVDWRQIDYVDDWGNVESNGGLLARFFNSFINPAYVNDIVVTDVDTEIARIKEENGSNIAPERRKAEIVVSVYDDEGTKISSEKVKLNGDQYGKYQREYGKQYALMAASLMASDYYDELSDSDRVKAFEEIESLADEFGKLAADVGYVIEPGSNDDKLYTLTELGMPVAEAYAARLMYRQLNRDEDIKPTDKYERFRTWVLDNEEWTDKEKTAVIDTFGKFSSGFVVSSENYDELISSGTMDASTASSITEGIRALEPQEGKEEVSDYQKYEFILGRTDLNAKQRDAALVSYMSAKEKERYDACAATGVSATTYITALSDIHNLTPLAGRDAVTDGQKWEVCIKAVSSEKQRDALLDRYMDSSQAAKYDMARSAGVSPKLYVKYYNAKYTYGDKNGSWKQSELQSWLDANVSSTSQKAVLWEIANSGWKNNPYR